MAICFDAVDVVFFVKGCSLYSVDVNSRGEVSTIHSELGTYKTKYHAQAMGLIYENLSLFAWKGIKQEHVDRLADVLRKRELNNQNNSECGV